MSERTAIRVYYNAKIYTMNPSLPSASAFAVDGGLILAVGDANTILNEFAGKSIQIDMAGTFIIPGLIDAHIHLEQYALGRQQINCETSTRQDCLGAVAEKAAQTTPGEWILGHGWNQNNWLEGFGTKELLDSAAPSNPVYLTAKSLHAGWANSAALRLAGINAGTPDPEGGQIKRSPEGLPTGILLESAMSIMSDTIPEPTIDQVLQAIEHAQSELWAMGLTGVHDFDRRRCFIALQKLHAEGKLKLRVLKSIPLESLSQAAQVGLRSGFGDDWLRIGSIKAFADGALGPRTAAMLQPYDGEPDNKGILMLDSETLFEQGRIAVENGLSLAVHAIGDLANHEVLTAYAQIREYEHKLITEGNSPFPASELRHRIEHVQIIHPKDIQKVADLNIIASMQPIHVTSDFPAADRYWGERSRYSYAWRSVMNSGAQLAFGSDAPVESPNPFWGIHAALTRRRSDGSPGPDGWHPEEKLTLNEVLRGFTSGAAYAAHMEDRLGKLAPGYLADLVVLDKDLYNCPPEEIRDISPLGTMVAGEWVHLSHEFSEQVSGV